MSRRPILAASCSGVHPSCNIPHTHAAELSKGPCEGGSVAPADPGSRCRVAQPPQLERMHAGHNGQCKRPTGCQPQSEQGQLMGLAMPKETLQCSENGRQLVLRQ
jgi:hypothetical protein